MAATYAGRLNPMSITDLFGNRLIGATVTVKDADQITDSTLWSDRDRVTQINNPVTVDGDGNIEFYAEPGLHYFEIRVTGVLEDTLEWVVNLHPNEVVT